MTGGTATRTDIDVDKALQPQDAVPSAAAKGSGDERANQDMHVDSVYVAVPQVSETGDTVLGQTELSCHDEAHQAERTNWRFLKPLEDRLADSKGRSLRDSKAKTGSSEM